MDQETLDSGGNPDHVRVRVSVSLWLWLGGATAVLWICVTQHLPFTHE